MHWLFGNPAAIQCQTVGTIRRMEGIVTLTSRGQHGAEGSPAAPVKLHSGHMSPGARFRKRPTGSRDWRGLQVDNTDSVCSSTQRTVVCCQGKAPAKRQIEITRVIGSQAVRPREGEYAVEGTGGRSIVHLKRQSAQ